MNTERADEDLGGEILAGIGTHPPGHRPADHLAVPLIENRERGRSLTERIKSSASVDISLMARLSPIPDE